MPVTDHADALPPGGDDVGVQPQRVDARVVFLQVAPEPSGQGAGHVLQRGVVGLVLGVGAQPLLESALAFGGGEGGLFLVELGAEAGAVRAAEMDDVPAVLAGLAGVQADSVVAARVRAGRVLREAAVQQPGVGLADHHQATAPRDPGRHQWSAVA
ncbi:hypothetical protein AB0904_24795 [Streptomyces sp. NPDC006684]|uniref:hypothetical protein n=1 Tax=Streptomyces sp. NPDC006684 TaxID=3154477 RepID=UPI003453164E